MSAAPPATAALNTTSSTVDSDDVSSDASIDDDEQCVVCLDAPRSVMFMHGSSAHLCMCSGCERRYDWRGQGCAMCRQPVEDVVHLNENVKPSS
jgi:hypothetical protein